MAKAKRIEDMTPEELRVHNAEQARIANQNRNKEQLDRRNAIAEELDEARGADFNDIDGDRILPNKKSAKAARTAEEIEADAERDEQEAETERRRLAAQGDDEDEESVNRGPGNQDPDDDEEDDGADGDNRSAAGEGDEGESRVTNGVRYYRCIVNGKEKWLTLAQLRNTAQKVESADEYLQNAAASVRNAAALQPSHEDAGADDEDDAEELLNKALLGDQDSVKKLAQRLKATPSRVTPDVLQAVDERMTFREAVNWFEDEFEEELSDPRLKAMIVDEDARLARETPTMGYRKRLKQAGTAIRNWKATLTGATGEDQGNAGTQQRKPQERTPSPKEQRKRNLSDLPRAGGRQADGGHEDAEETVGTVIEQMAKSRHQGRAIKH